jgi:AraC-like DNA-binding protein
MSLLTFRMPRQALAADIPVQRLNAALASTALGHLVGKQFGLLGQAMRLANPDAIASIARSVESLFLALADEMRRKEGVSLEPRTTARHMKNFALVRINDLELSVAALAAAFHCTVRTVQNYFAADGETFSAWILEERLVRAHAILCDASQARRTIESIGYSCGFASVAHFHRAFKARFGSSPGALRKS